MDAGDFQDWMYRAFLFVEAALAHEMATPSRACMTEDYFRSALMRGLANSMPNAAMRVGGEENAPWAGNACWNDCGESAGGRPIQHDVVIQPEGTDSGLLCEV